MEIGSKVRVATFYIIDFMQLNWSHIQLVHWSPQQGVYLRRKSGLGNIEGAQGKVWRGKGRLQHFDVRIKSKYI